MNYYQTLGADEDATQEELKSKYRDLCRQQHPDKGGNEEIFKEITEAYAVLGCPATREHYDRTGNTKNQTLANSGIQFMLTVLMEIIHAIPEGKEVDPIEMAKVALQEIIHKQSNEIVKTQDDKLNLKKILKRIINKGDQPFIESALEDRIRDKDRIIESTREAIKVTQKAIEALDLYEFEPLEALKSTWHGSFRNITIRPPGYYTFGFKGV